MYLELKWLAYYIIWLLTKPCSIKQKAFTLKHGLNVGIYSSPSEMNMHNSDYKHSEHINILKMHNLYSFTPIFSVYLEHIKALIVITV